jgi:hypothetical protein
MVEPTPNTRRPSPTTRIRRRGAARVVSGWVLVLAVVGPALLLGGCGGSGRAAPTPAAIATAGGASTTVHVPGGADVPARLYGRGATNGAVLVPDTGRSAGVWEPYASSLARSGVVVLALDLGGGRAPTEEMIRAAAAQLRAGGTDKVALVGEGAGGTAALAASVGGDINAVAVISSPSTAHSPAGDTDGAAALAAFDHPVLVMASLGDADGTAAASRLYNAAHDPRTRALIPGNARGTDILRGPSSSEAGSVLSDFLHGAFAPLSAGHIAPSAAAA